MRKNHITIVIRDPNLFYVKGLKSCLSESFSRRDIQTNFTDCAFDSRAKIILIAEELLSIANIHCFNRRMSMRPLGVFIIRNNDENTQTETNLHGLKNYMILNRNQSVESMLSVLDEKLDQLNTMHNVPIQPYSMMSLKGHNLTRRETEILRYLARGISNGGVARCLHISEKTVSAHKRNIMCKLNMIRPAELNYWLIHEGWCDTTLHIDQFH